MQDIKVRVFIENQKTCENDASVLSRLIAIRSIYIINMRKSTHSRYIFLLRIFFSCGVGYGGEAEEKLIELISKDSADSFSDIKKYVEEQPLNSLDLWTKIKDGRTILDLAFEMKNERVYNYLKDYLLNNYVEKKYCNSLDLWNVNKDGETNLDLAFAMKDESVYNYLKDYLFLSLLEERFVGKDPEKVKKNLKKNVEKLSECVRRLGMNSAFARQSSGISQSDLNTSIRNNRNSVSRVFRGLSRRSNKDKIISDIISDIKKINRLYSLLRDSTWGYANVDLLHKLLELRMSNILKPEILDILGLVVNSVVNDPFTRVNQIVEGKTSLAKAISLFIEKLDDPAKRKNRNHDFLVSSIKDLVYHGAIINVIDQDQIDDFKLAVETHIDELVRIFFVDDENKVLEKLLKKGFLTPEKLMPFLINQVEIYKRFKDSWGFNFVLNRHYHKKHRQ